MTIRLMAALAMVTCLAACGSGDKSSPTTAKAPAGGPAPASLAGIYTTELTKQDLARNRAPELQVPPGWKLTIANTGGTGSGRALTIANAKAGALEAPDFAVTGDRIVLKHEECAAGGTTHFYDNEYRFTQSGKMLRFTTVKNRCPDKVAETVLTSRAWKKQGG